MASPAERYAAARRRTEESRSELAQFAGTLGFDLDGFQLQACQALESGRGVLVAAPTGAGKTVVGEFAAHLALRTGRKAFYTTPIKALSNQKYAELVARHGSGAVGLLTGDNSVNGEAPVVVMTTEVLRNMLYAGPPCSTGSGTSSWTRSTTSPTAPAGPVWEEVIIHLPSDVVVASLSATVSNAEEFGAWLDTVRGTPRWWSPSTGPSPCGSTCSSGTGCTTCSPTPTATRSRVTRGPSCPARSSTPSSWRCRASRSAPTGSPPTGRGRRRGQARPRPWWCGAVGPASAVGSAPSPGRRCSTPWTRRGCCPPSPSSSAAPAATPPSSSAWRGGCGSRPRGGQGDPRPRRGALRRDPQLRPRRARVLGLARRGSNGAGRAPHAGMLPVFKETVEHLFARGLVKAVFATETLASASTCRRARSCWRSS